MSGSLARGQSLTSASSEARMAWMGMRPDTMNCPPAWRAAERERCSPAVLVDEHTGDAARLHGFGKVLNILGGENLRDLRF